MIRRLLDLFPLTPGGALVLALSAVGVRWYGVDRADLVVLAVGGVGLVAATAALLAVLGTSIATWLALRNAVTDAPLELEAGRPGRTGFSVAHPWFVPFVAIDWTWVEPEATVTVLREWGRLHEQISAHRRGEHDVVARRIEVADLLGIARIAFRVTETRRVRFVPGTGRLEQVQVVQGMAGGDVLSHPDGPPSGDRLDLRNYSAGDPIRYVLWKVFARSRELVVRNPEHALAPARQTVAYLVAGKGDEAAAGAARVAVRSGSLGGDWTFGADGAADTARSASQAMELIVRSGNVAPTGGGEGLRTFLQKASRGPVKRAVVFVPASPGPWMERVAAAAQVAGRNASLEFLVCADDVERDRSASIVKRVFFASTDEEARQRATSSDLQAVVTALGRLGGRVMLVDRQGGRVLPAAALRKRR